jgi:hypothetical protein
MLDKIQLKAQETLKVAPFMWFATTDQQPTEGPLYCFQGNTQTEATINQAWIGNYQAHEIQLHKQVLCFAILNVTKHCSQVGRSPALYWGSPGFKPKPRNRVALFCGFHVLQANAGIVHQIKSQPLPSICFPNHYSLTILPLNALYITDEVNTLVISLQKEFNTPI